jgi:plasmid stability protein
MPVMIQIRNVPDAVHLRLKEQATAAGMSLSEYLLRETSLIAERLSMEEMRARLAARKPAKLSESPTKIIRAARDRS